MCGIVGYIGEHNCVPIIMNGLKKLEYRGYDSAGIGSITNNECLVIKSKGEVTKLEDKIKKKNFSSTTGIGHTRWATHGEPSVINAHPHQNKDKTLAIIHNGIIENYQSLKHELELENYKFESLTDSEVIAHMIDKKLKENNSFFESVRMTCQKIEGTYGLVALYKNEPDKLVVAKKGSPLVIGIGENENFIASDTNALINVAEEVVYLEDNEVAEIYKDRIVCRTLTNGPLVKHKEKIEVESEEISKKGHAHYMKKEIMEQVDTFQNSYRGRIDLQNGTAKLEEIDAILDKVIKSKRIIISACGTSWHSGLIGEYLLEKLARIPAEVEYASEFRYRDPVITKKDTVIFISQSGETADTLAALKEVKKRSATTISLCNVVGSSIARESECTIYTHAGPEIGVASTKAFTSQIIVLTLLALKIARKKKLSKKDGIEILQELKNLPSKVAEILRNEEEIKILAKKLSQAKNCLYLGRGINFPVALEGALKLKEISYIHAEGYPAAEMKHGPIALIDKEMPVVFIAPQDSVYEKVISNIEEVKARKGIIVAVANYGDEDIDELADYVLKVPKTLPVLMPLINVIPLQLLAYYMAVEKNLNVDQPRNLAKSVTVE